VRTRAGLLVTVFVSSMLLIACSSPRGPSTGGAGPEAMRIGQAAPDFTLPTASGSTLSLAQFRGHKPVLLYFSMGPG
jgi:cytochrome oxidase Cu insertion factor (SCO1/SenC/PrrC family)